MYKGFLSILVGSVLVGLLFSGCVYDPYGNAYYVGPSVSVGVGTDWYGPGWYGPGWYGGYYYSGRHYHHHHW
jgi:hypothetical protein